MRVGACLCACVFVGVQKQRTYRGAARWGPCPAGAPTPSLLGEDLSRETEAELHCLSLSLVLPPLPILCLQRYGVGTSWHPSVCQFAFRSLGQYATRAQTDVLLPPQGAAWAGISDWKGHELSRLDWEELGDTVAKDGSHRVGWAAKVGHEGWLDQAGMPPAGWGWGPAWHYCRDAGIYGEGEEVAIWAMTFLEVPEPSRHSGL